MLNDLTRFGLWDALDRPGGFYTLWCSKHWRMFELIALGRRTISDAEHREFMLVHARDFDVWLRQQYGPRIFGDAGRRQSTIGGP